MSDFEPSTVEISNIGEKRSITSMESNISQESVQNEENISKIIVTGHEEDEIDLNFQPLCTPCVTVVTSDENKDDVNNVNESIYIPPIERVITPGDVTDITDDDETIYIIGTKDAKVTTISGLQNNQKLKELTLRSCLVSRIEGLEGLQNLEKLELYDNVIESFHQLEYVSNLLILDVSFNAIKDMSPVRVCRRLKELYIAQNKIREIVGMEDMNELKILDLGANRIRSMEGIQGLISLESLWLGKNKIEKIEYVSSLPRLRQLDIQNNRLTSLGDDLNKCLNLNELYLACNAITSTVGIPIQSPLKTIDLSSNKIKGLEGVENCLFLEELWMTGSAIESLDELTSLIHLKSLTCLYLEHSPIAIMDDYRQKMKSMFPSLEQLDADLY